MAMDFFGDISREKRSNNDVSNSRFLSRPALDRAALAVQDELDALGLWGALHKTDVVWCALPCPALPLAYGYFLRGRVSRLERFLGWRPGHIYMPAVSVHPRAVLDTLRHEYGHALAHRHPRRTRTRAFRAAFGGDGWHAEPTLRQRAAHCVSAYAQTCPMEDFAETFMVYVRRQGRAPAKMTDGLRRKWEVVAHL